MDLLVLFCLSVAWLGGGFVCRWCWGLRSVSRKPQTPTQTFCLWESARRAGVLRRAEESLTRRVRRAERGGQLATEKG